MFKTALRLSALTLIVAGAFYCGRASTYGKSEPVDAEPNATVLRLSDLPKISDEIYGIKFQLQKAKSLSAWANETMLPEIPSAKKTRALNRYDMLYHLEWDDQNNCFLFDGKTIEQEKNEQREIFLICPGFSR
jgi:hypothetical protein